MAVSAVFDLQNFCIFSPPAPALVLKMLCAQRIFAEADFAETKSFRKGTPFNAKIKDKLVIPPLTLSSLRLSLTGPASRRPSAFSPHARGEGVFALLNKLKLHNPCYLFLHDGFCVYAGMAVFQKIISVLGIF